MVSIPDLTLLIMVHNNAEYAERAIRYYENLDCTKIILDSSDQSIIRLNKIPDGYRYYHALVSFFKKQQDIVQDITT